MSDAARRTNSRWPPLPGSPFAPIPTRIAGWTHTQLAVVREEGESLELEIGALLSEGAEPGCDEAQQAIARWAMHVARFGPLTSEQFEGLGEHYVTNPALRARYEAIEPGLAEFLRDAMRIYSNQAGAREPRSDARDVGTSLP